MFLGHPQMKQKITKKKSVNIKIRNYFVHNHGLYDEFN